MQSWKENVRLKIKTENNKATKTMKGEEQEQSKKEKIYSNL